MATRVAKPGSGACSAKMWTRPSAPSSMAARALGCVLTWTTASLPRRWAAWMRAAIVARSRLGICRPCAEPSAIRASTQAWASSGLVSVGTGSPYWVPWPPGAVARYPALFRSARSGAPVFSCSARMARAKPGSVNMSSSVVTPNWSARARAAQVWVWRRAGRAAASPRRRRPPVLRPGASPPAHGSDPAALHHHGPAGIIREPSKIRALTMAKLPAAGVSAREAPGAASRQAAASRA
ncbi:MAG TPA: hypothetical protein VGG03_27960 [Thermoanaerobaculia bacterium]